MEDEVKALISFISKKFIYHIYYIPTNFPQRLKSAKKIFNNNHYLPIRASIYTGS